MVSDFIVASFIFFKLLNCFHSNRVLQKLAFVQYRFERFEHPIKLQPHGNCKENNDKPLFRRTKHSTLKLIKKAVSSGSEHPSTVLRDIEGGIMKAKHSCELPRNRRQIYNFKSITKSETATNSMVTGIMPRNGVSTNKIN